MKTINEFKKDFAEEIETGALIIADEVSDLTIFILRDGTIIDAEFNEYGDRCTDHRQVLSVQGYSMNDLVTIEPESQTLILPDNELTWDQVESLGGLEEIYTSLEVQGSYYNYDSIYLIQHLVDCGASLKACFNIIKLGTWAIIPDEELDDYTAEEQDEFFYLENDTIVDVW